MPRKSSKKTISKTQHPKSSSFSKAIVNKVIQKDIVMYMLSFLANNTLIQRTNDRYNSLYFKAFRDEQIYDASYYGGSTVPARDLYHAECGSDPASFNVLPVSLKRISKVFNYCVSKLSRLIFCFNLDLNIAKLSTSITSSSLKQLYWTQDLSRGTNQQIKNNIDALQHFNFPNLQILQIHYFYFCYVHEEYKHELNISLDMYNLPNLHTLIIGSLFDYSWDDLEMQVNTLELDLDIAELRIQNCSIKDLESLRLSIATCPLIEILVMQLNRFDKQVCLHSLCLESVKLMFFQSDWLNSLSVYAPNLQIAQFYFCDKLDKFILLERISNKFKFMHRYVTNSCMDDDQMPDTQTDHETCELIVGFDNCYEYLVDRHFAKFTVLKNGQDQRLNEKCIMQFSCSNRAMLVWPHAKMR